MKARFLKVSALFVVLTLLPSFLSLCHAQVKEGEGHDRDKKEHREAQEGKGHDSDEKKGESEEDGTMYNLAHSYDMTKHGVNLILKYDDASNSFKGKVTNVSSKTADRVRVEVHLSNGTELGPTTPVNLKPNESHIIIIIDATKKSFEKWSTHAEVDNREHSGSECSEGHDESEGREEHREGEKGEHN